MKIQISATVKSLGSILTDGQKDQIRNIANSTRKSGVFKLAFFNNTANTVKVNTDKSTQDDKFDNLVPANGTLELPVLIEDYENVYISSSATHDIYISPIY